MTGLQVTHSEMVEMWRALQSPGSVDLCSPLSVEALRKSRKGSCVGGKMVWEKPPVKEKMLKVHER